MFRPLRKSFRYFDCPAIGKSLAIATLVVCTMTIFLAPPARALSTRSIGETPRVLQSQPQKSSDGPIAELADRVLEAPPILQPRQFRQELPTAIPRPTEPTEKAGPGQTTTSSGNKEYDLDVAYIESELYNPSTKGSDKVRLRGYINPNLYNPKTKSYDTPKDYSFVAPTIEVNPGNTVRVNLNNRLPLDPSCPDDHPDVNVPHCFNSTNLHSHGLWISPSGNSDNVLLTIRPGVKFQYEYNIPPDHPAGTFWYHPHLHGSTALQVASGMVGALIVRGDRPPQVKPNAPQEFLHGDIDTLLKDDQLMPEQVLVLQQIQYACLNSDRSIKVKKDSTEWLCEPRDQGEIEFYKDTKGKELFGFNSWRESGRFTSINGKIRPEFEAIAGEIQRWRLIHAGVRDTVSLEFRPLIGTDIRPLLGAKAGDIDRAIAENCGDPIEYHVIADDGLTRSTAWKTTVTTLQPGYRNDALVVFPNSGQYCVVDTSAPASGSVTGETGSRQLLGSVMVYEKVSPNAPSLPIPDISAYLQERLIASAEKNFDPSPVRDRVIADLKNGLKLSLFTPHLDIKDSEKTGTRKLAFYIDTSRTPATFEVGNNFGPKYDGQPYNPDRVDRTLKLGDVDEWTLQSYLGGHPFHIHVNPFQIVEILDPNGKDVSLPDAVDDWSCNQPGSASDCKPDPQYPGLKGVWKDTLWIKGAGYPNGIYTVVARTRYQRYIGEFVLHCHILDHEDQGMMQNVQIVVPDGKYTDFPVAMTSAN